MEKIHDLFFFADRTFLFISTINMSISLRDGFDFVVSPSYGYEAFKKSLIVSPFIMLVGFGASFLCIRLFIKTIKVKKWDEYNAVLIKDDETKKPDTSSYIDELENYTIMP